MAPNEPLVKRALSKRLGSTTRFAERGSTVRVKLAGSDGAEGVKVVVQNRGEAMTKQRLPCQFDRFFRDDSSRCCDQ